MVDRRAAAALLALLALQSCAPGGGGGPGSGRPPSGGVGQGLKAPLAGLLDRQGFPASGGFDPALGGFVVNATWARLQPDPGGPLSTGGIDEAVSRARAYNSSHPAHPFRIKLRITAGVDAPEWAKRLGGSPVDVTSTRPPLSGTVGRFWEPAYQAAYAAFQSALATRYDGVPEIREVVISQCMTFYAEPFIRQTSAPATVRDLLAAGFTTEADRACQESAVRAHLAWKRTRSDLTVNPYQAIEPDGTTRVDESFTEGLMAYCRQVLGPRCVLENNSIRDPIQRGAYPAMYARMQAMGRPMAFQLATMSRVGSLTGAISLAAGYGAEAVELPQGYESASTPGELARSASGLKAG